MVRKWLTLATLMVFLLLLPAALRGQAAGIHDGAIAAGSLSDQGPPTDQIIIKFADPVVTADVLAANQDQVMDRLSWAAGISLSYYRPMSGAANVLKLPGHMPLAEVEAVSAALAALPDVEYAQPDRIWQLIGQPTMEPELANVIPNDPNFGAQWHYGYTANTDEGINLIPAWGITTGANSTVVAVIDTGILDHADLAGRVVDGYDFISNSFMGNDDDGRDPDPSDPGDWVTSNECLYSHPPSNSSWHGTHVAGTIGAATNNNLGVAGVNWQARILPVRVLGKCGGLLSDIIDGSRWAAGLAVDGVPANNNPAQVLNLSLGGSGSCASDSAMQEAINDIVAAGVTVVVAAGNSNADASGFSPASCDDVITVAANDRTGDRAWYSNYGDKIEVSAPGGETSSNSANGILSTLNTGTTGPGTDTFAFYQGTSMATPHVAGLASLILGLQPAATPAEVLDRLQDTARDFPASSSCKIPGQDPWEKCGAGIVDAYQALNGLVTFDQMVYLPFVTRSEEIVIPSVYFSHTDYQVAEASGPATIEVRLSEPAIVPVRVNYASGGGTATPGDDYKATNGILEFNPGQLSKSFSVTIYDNDIYEANETVGLALSNPDQAILGQPAAATLTINNDDEPPQSIANGDFEAGESAWTQYSSHNWTLILPDGSFPVGVQPHGGNWAVWLGGDYSDISYIAQDVTVPSGAPYFTYWHWIASGDFCGYDRAGVIINSSIVVDVYDLCEAEDTGGWVKHVVDLSAYANQTVNVQIRAETDSTLNSNLFVDDVSFEVSADLLALPPEYKPDPKSFSVMSRSSYLGRDGTAVENELEPRLFSDGR